MQEDVLDRIREQYGGMSKGHKKIASFILEHYDQAVFMTAARLGDALRISESTVVRFASELGYDGYPSMQRALQEMIRSRLTSTQRIRAAGDLRGAAGFAVCCDPVGYRQAAADERRRRSTGV